MGADAEFDDSGRDAPSIDEQPRAQAEERLRRIELITDVALARLDVEDLLAEMLERIRELLSTDTAAVLLIDDSGSFVVATAARGIEEEVRQGVRVPLGRGFAGRIAAQRRPVILDQINSQTVANPILWRKGIQSMLGVPLLNGDELVGVLHVGTLAPRQFSAEDVAVLELAADRVATAVATRQGIIDRAAAAALQRSLAPQQLPSLPGLDLAARYVPSGLYGVGGDWYDVFALPSGSYGIVIGDVMGHGLGAAAIMGRLRSELRAYALEVEDPARVLERLDRAVQHFERGQLGTVLYAVLSPRMDRLWISSAGHIPPVLAQPGAAAVSVELPIHLPLGVSPDAPRSSRTIELPRHALLCLFTDGLIEDRRSDVSIDERLEQLRATLSGEVLKTADAACAELMASLIGDREPDDDVSMLAVKLL